MRLALSLLCLFLLIPTLGQAAPLGPRDVPPAFAPFAQVETHRVRIVNAADGAVEVSSDRGKTWQLVGRVTAPAVESLTGYLASGYAPPGTVAATAVHGLRIRVGDLKSAYPKMVNVLPREFARTLKTFGGHVAGDSGIYTNIPTGTGIFRELCPYVGNRVYLDGDRLTSLPVNYVPRVGDTLVIIVRRPVNPLTQVVFQNKEGGDVTATYADSAAKVITHIVKPVLGTGRFDGTSYTGVGALNTNHCGVITVSTAPVTTSTLLEGDGGERRGGFQIEPAYHNSQSEEAGGFMVLVVGLPGQKYTMSQEGTPPLFSGYFNLAWDPKDPKHSWRAEIQRGDGTPWLPMPQSLGNQPSALRGVTAIRLVCDTPLDDDWRSQRIALAVRSYREEARRMAEAGKTTIERGRLTIKANDADPRIQVVTFSVDGVLKGLTNQRPYRFTWDTSDSPDGEYAIEARAADATGNVISVTRTRVWVDNTRQIAHR